MLRLLVGFWVGVMLGVPLYLITGKLWPVAIICILGGLGWQSVWERIIK